MTGILGGAAEVHRAHVVDPPPPGDGARHPEGAAPARRLLARDLPPLLLQTPLYPRHHQRQQTVNSVLNSYSQIFSSKP